MLGNEEEFKVQKFERGNLIFKVGDAVDGLFLLKEGKILLVSIEDNRVIPLYSIKGEGTFGEDCLFSINKKYTYYAVAMENSKVILIPKKGIESTLLSRGEWVRNVLSDMSEKSLNTSELIKQHKIVDSKLSAEEELSDTDEILIRNTIQQ